MHRLTHVVMASLAWGVSGDISSYPDDVAAKAQEIKNVYQELKLAFRQHAEVVKTINEIEQKMGDLDNLANLLQEELEGQPSQSTPPEVSKTEQLLTLLTNYPMPHRSIVDFY